MQQNSPVVNSWKTLLNMLCLDHHLPYLEGGITMKLGWDPDIYPSSLDYEEALKSGKHFNNVNKEINSKKRIYDAQNKNFPSPTISVPTFNKKGSLRAVIIALVILGSLLSSVVEIAKPIIKDFFRDDSQTPVVALESGTSQLTSDVGLPVYRISSSNDAIKELLVPSGDSTLSVSSGINTESAPYLVVSGSEQTFDLFAISSAILDKEYMAPFLSEESKLMDSTYIDYAFPDFDQDGDVDVIVYIGNDSDYPIVEVFINQVNEKLGFSEMGYFESYPVTNISSTGLIQRIDDNNAIYDEIIVDQDGLRILDGK